MRPQLRDAVFGLALSGLCLTGCQSVAGLPVLVAARGDGVAQIQTATGLMVTYDYASVFVKLVPKSAVGSAAASLPAFSSVVVTCQSEATALASWTATLDPAAFDSDGRSKRPALTQLPARGDLSVRVFMRDTSGKLVGSGVLDKLTFKRGYNDVPIEVASTAIADQEPQLLGASDGLNVKDGVIIKEGSLIISSGFAKGAPGVDHVLVEINGKAYGDGTQTASVATLTPAEFEDFNWEPEIAQGTYDPTIFLAKDGQPTPFSLVFKAVDKSGNVISTRTITLKLESTATVEVGFNN